MKWEDYSETTRLSLSEKNPPRILDVLRADAEREAKMELRLARERYVADPSMENGLELLKWSSSVRSGCYEIPLGPIPLGPLPIWRDER